MKTQLLVVLVALGACAGEDDVMRVCDSVPQRARVVVTERPELEGAKVTLDHEELAIEYELDGATYRVVYRLVPKPDVLVEGP